MKCPGHDNNQTCSIHGTCDENSGKCSCDDGFYSEDCSSNVFKYELAQKTLKTIFVIVQTPINNKKVTMFNSEDSSSNGTLL